MILEHQFDAETHTYRVPGYFVLGTSDVIALNSFAEYGQIPKAVLENASLRGSEVHQAIEWFETDAEPPAMPSEIERYFNGWLKFRTKFEFEPVGRMEKQIVYQFGEAEHAIGATIDARGLLGGKPYVLDIKTSSKQSGKALKQKLLCWRMQLQSYLEATALDEEWWKTVNASQKAGRAIVQLSKDGEFTFHDFSHIDDTESWSAAVHVAQLKLKNGFELVKRA